MSPDAELFNALSAAWSFAAFSLRYPDRELACAVAEGAWGEAALGIAAGLRRSFGVDVALEPAIGAAAGASAGDADACLGELRREATRLFVGCPEPVLPPYEGVWRSREDGSEALLAVNPHCVAVERFCKRCGLGHPKGTNEPLDHVSAECELMSYLAYRACEEALGVAADPDMPGASAQAAYDAFCAEHARAWMPQFADELEQASELAFYRVTAKVLRAVATAKTFQCIENLQRCP